MAVGYGVWQLMGVLSGGPIVIGDMGWPVFCGASLTLGICGLLLVMSDCSHPPACASGLVVVLGAVTALLLTTKTGEETRETLAEYGASFKENLPEGIKEKTDEALDRGREYLDEKKKALNEAIEAGKVAMAKEKEDLSTTLDEDNA